MGSIFRSNKINLTKSQTFPRLKIHEPCCENWREENKAWAINGILAYRRCKHVRSPLYLNGNKISSLLSLNIKWTFIISILIKSSNRTERVACQEFEPKDIVHIIFPLSAMSPYPVCTHHSVLMRALEIYH